MSNPLVCHNPNILPSIESFDPSRWLDNSQLDRYLVSFSKGPRGCVGLNLSWAELCFTVAALFARYGSGGRENGRTIKLWKTTEEGVKAVHGFFVPAPRLSSQGVRIVVSG
jgi:cytochrome P450